MLPPHKCLLELDAEGVNQKLISEKVGVSQSSISRIQRRIFKRPSWQAVERIQSLHAHVCLDQNPVDEFPDYEDYLALEDKELA